MQNIVQKLRLADDSDTSNYMIFGDFNFIDHDRDKRHGLSPKDTNLNKIWTPFIEEMDMVDPFREQNPRRKIWSFIGTGMAGNSRIDRIYVNSINMNDITDIRYINTPFHGHRILSFNIKKDIEWGKGYYKLNTSLFEDEEYDNLVDQTIADVEALNNRPAIQKWEVFMMTMKARSIEYSTKKNKAKKRLKNEIIKQIFEIEKGKREEPLAEHYSYLKGRQKEIEDKEIEGYIRRTKFCAPYEKQECDIAFYSKIEGQKRSSDRINQLAESKDGEIFTDKENIMRISTNFYKKLYTSEKTDSKAQEKLLGNIKAKLTAEARENLDKDIAEKEAKNAIATNWEKPLCKCHKISVQKNR